MTIDLERIEKWCNHKLFLWLVFIIWSLFVTNLWLPRNWGFYGNQDWDLTYATFESARKSIVEYGQWPSFNPYLAFGSDLNANPQSGHISIFFIPILLFGSFYGYKVSILMAIMLGLFGFRSLLLKTGTNGTVSTLLSLLFCSASYFSRHIMEVGHSNFLYFYLIPYLFVFIENFRIKQKPIHAVIASLILAQFILGGAPLIFITACMMIVMWGIYLIGTKSNTWKWSLSSVIIMSLGFGLALWKILPVLDFWIQNPRIVTDDSGINPLVWLDALADFKTDTRTPHDWHEFSIGIGILSILLIFYYRKHLTFFNVGLLLMIPVVWLSMGNTPSFLNPWYFLHHFFPFFNGLRAPSRFSFIFLFVACICLAIIVNKEYHNRLLLMIISGLVLSNTLSYNAVSHSLVNSKRMEHFNQVVRLAPPKVVKTGKKDLYDNVVEGKLVLDAYEPQHLPEVNDTLKSFIDGGMLLSFSPNKIVFETGAYQTFLNLRYSNNWHSDQIEVKEMKGLIYLEGKPGDKITLEYKNQLVEQSMRISAILLVFSLIFSATPIFKRRS